jgi:hypothetical protein
MKEVMWLESILNKMILQSSLQRVLSGSPKIIVPESRSHLLALAMGGEENDFFEVGYEVPSRGYVVEATVAKCKNGLAVNYNDTYLRRRDPDSMVIGDDFPSDKKNFKDRFGKDFSPLREEALEWLSNQELILIPFVAGGSYVNHAMLLVCPANAGFFAGGLADLQGFIPLSELPDGFEPKSVIYVAPPFRYTHLDEKQIVVHNRTEEMYELFSFNLYPGPSAKKGVYGVLLHIGEQEGWTTAHTSTVMVVTPYGNIITIMHEGASGGGKSEMAEHLHRESDGKILLGKNVINKEKLHFELKEGCELRPITDDMALCHPSFQNDSKRLVLTDAEQGWFIRTDHITRYGTHPYLEEMCTHPPEPLIFLNIDGVPGGTCLIWDHKMDEPGKPCPNPRVIIPRSYIPNIVSEPTEVDVRSFGVRTPPTTSENPNYGIMGLFHILPPSIAWLWRLVAPRGHANPSITDTGGMKSEGVGSYWPFATGRKVNHANILLKQIVASANTRYILIPNQHIGAYKVGFMPQWVAREYLARRGSARFNEDQLLPSRCTLLGYSIANLKVDGSYIPKELLQVERQPEVGKAGFDAGAEILTQFFKKELKNFNSKDLDPLGAQIIDCCMSDGTLEDYLSLIPIKF